MRKSKRRKRMSIMSAFLAESKCVAGVAGARRAFNGANQSVESIDRLAEVARVLLECCGGRGGCGTGRESRDVVGPETPEDGWMAERRLSLLEAVSLNMSLMVGIGPFITLPALVGTLGGPAVDDRLGAGRLVALADGMVWSELAAAFPGSGGTYHFYDAAYGASRVGRMLKFLFVWQFFFSGPLEIASGAIGLAKYLGYFFPMPAACTAWNWGSVFPGRDVPVVVGPGGRHGGDGARDGAGLSADLRCGQADGRALGRDAAHGGLGDRGRRRAGSTRGMAFDFPAGAFRVRSAGWPWDWAWL